MVIMMIKKLKRVLIPIVLSIICGSVCGKLVYDIYEPSVKEVVMGKKIYLVQAGAYSNYDSMVDNTLVNNYIYYEDKDGLYKAIIGVTEEYDNISKIASTYSGEVIVSEYYSMDSEMNKKIEEYDEKISGISDSDELKSVVLEMLTLYKDNEDNTLVKVS